MNSQMTSKHMSYHIHQLFWHFKCVSLKVIINLLFNLIILLFNLILVFNQTIVQTIRLEWKSLSENDNKLTSFVIEVNRKNQFHDCVLLPKNPYMPGNSILMFPHFWFILFAHNLTHIFNYKYYFNPHN